MLAQIKALFMRVAILSLLLSLCAFASAQSTTLNPVWMQNGWVNPYQPQYSWTGTSVLLWNGNEIEVYNSTTGQVISKIEVDGQNGFIQSACFTSGGTNIFYAITNGSTSKVIDYKISNATQATLNISESQPIRMLTTSHNGATLAYIVTDPLNGDDMVCLYSLTTLASIARFDYQNPGSSNTTASLGFVDADQEVVLSGPTIYNLSGTRVSVVSKGSLKIAPFF
jgi:WD40 repeat protein